MASSLVGAATPQLSLASKLRYLSALERKVLWLAVWTIYHANHIRPKRDGLKVGGHQASSASAATLLAALYFDVLTPHDRVAVKPHAGPVFHAIQYLFGRQTRDKLERFRSYGGVQSYPSRTKDTDDVDFSTGSMGLGVAITSFASLVQDYVRLKGLGDGVPGRMVAIGGDAEFDEGSIFEALFEGCKHDVENVWWVVDYNRQSLDTMTAEELAPRLAKVFDSVGWRVVTLKYGKRLEAAFQRRGGEALKHWIDASSNWHYACVAHQGGAAWRQQLLRDLGTTSGIRELLDEYDDEGLQALMTNLGGHDMEVLLDAFHSANDPQPTCFVAYTVKGHRLPFAHHRDNHAGQLTPEQCDQFRREMHIPEGAEWDRFAGLDVSHGELEQFLASVPFNAPVERRHRPPAVPVPAVLRAGSNDRPTSTQEGFGKLMSDIARHHAELADHIVTTAPDVTVSTNLGAWVNRRGVFGRIERGDQMRTFNVASAQRWVVSPAGQHIELGIAENNLFLMLAALGLSAPMFNARLLPVGTVYDTFVGRGLDALNYACYQDARFILVATPAGVTLAPEGGAHQSISTPLIGMGQPGLVSFEPAYVDELAEILRYSFGHIQAEDGESVYLRLSTRALAQPARTLSDEQRADVLKGGYWLVPPTPATEVAFVVCGPPIVEVLEARDQLAGDAMDTAVMVVTSPDRLQHEWRACEREPGRASHIDTLLSAVPASAGLITVIDAHPASLAWIGAVARHRIAALGVDRFGQSGDIVDLYHRYGLDASAILDAAARLCVRQLHEVVTS